jgi:hypothetical protein
VATTLFMSLLLADVFRNFCACLGSTRDLEEEVEEKSSHTSYCYCDVRDRLNSPMEDNLSWRLNLVSQDRILLTWSFDGKFEIFAEAKTTDRRRETSF